MDEGVTVIVAGAMEGPLPAVTILGRVADPQHAAAAILAARERAVEGAVDAPVDQLAAHMGMGMAGSAGGGRGWASARGRVYSLVPETFWPLSRSSSLSASPFIAPYLASNLARSATS